MGGKRTVKLTTKAKSELEHGYQNGKKAAFRKRCHIILLKADDRTSKDIGKIVGLHEISVNSWLNRYEAEGISGLHTKPGRGRKPILDERTDKETIKQEVQKERQRLKKAKEILEEKLQKEFSESTLKRFLKTITADTKGLD